MRTAILMSCGATKLPHADVAMRLYRGSMWSTLRTHLGKFPSQDVYLLSAGFGFIGALEFIQPYEARLTQEVADRLIARGVQAPNDHCGRIPEAGAGACALQVFWPMAHRGYRAPYQRAFVAAGGLYRQVLDRYLEQFQELGALAPDATIERTEGGIGEQRQQLGQWLDNFNNPAYAALTHTTPRHTLSWERSPFP